MTAEQFNTFWTITYPDTIPIPHYFRHHYADRWFRIHSLPGSKRYANNKEEWNILLERQNKIITDLLGDNSGILLVTGSYFSEGYQELHPLEEADSVTNISFVSLEPIDLNELSPEEYEPGQVYKPMLSEQIWQSAKFDNLLKAIADDELRAFFVSVENECIVAPYDGGIDFILKDQHTKNLYKEIYREWLSARQDGL